MEWGKVGREPPKRPLPGWEGVSTLPAPCRHSRWFPQLPGDCPFPLPRPGSPYSEIGWLLLSAVASFRKVFFGKSL